MNTPHRPEPLSRDDHEKLVAHALETPIGQAIQGRYLQWFALSEWWNVDPKELLEARREAADDGMAASQEALDAMRPEDRSELLERSIELFRKNCWEAVFQLEALTLDIWEDPRKIDAELVATVAGLPVISQNARLLDEEED